MSSENKRFVIEYCQSATECIVGRSLLENSDVEVVRKGLGWRSIELGKYYSELKECERRFFRAQDIGWSDLADEFIIRPTFWMDFLSYEIHTGKELIMMLDNKKPLSVFVDSIPGSSGVIPEDIFSPYVKSARLLSKEYILHRAVNSHNISMRLVMYSQPEEEWRMDAYVENIRHADAHGHSPKTERREGELLGYTDEQNDEFLRVLQQRQEQR